MSKKIFENKRVVITNEIIGEADYPVTVVQYKRTGIRKAFIPQDGSLEISYTKAGSVVANDIVWPGRFSYETGVPFIKTGFYIAVELS
jgi:hypothetical protein